MWNENLKGIAVIQHFPLEASIYTVGDRLVDIFKGIDDLNIPYNAPVMVIINMKQNPSMTYAHAVEKSASSSPSRLIPILSNILQKYPMTEKIIIEGGSDIVIFSSREIVPEYNKDFRER